jgi:uncharacterized DUF497 family protein
MVREQIAGVWFEWDEKKSQRCWRERKFDFSAAAHVFFDERAIVTLNLEWQDEDRFQVVGEIPRIGAIFVVYVVREHHGENSIRILSARKATATEESDYRRQH